jgi:hypothetical protein
MKERKRCESKRGSKTERDNEGQKTTNQWTDKQTYRPTDRNKDKLYRGARYLTRENLKLVWVEFSTLSKAVLLLSKENEQQHTVISEVENSAQVFSC